MKSTRRPTEVTPLSPSPRRGRTLGVVLLGLGTLALVIPSIMAISSLVELIAPSVTRSTAAGPGKDKTSPRRDKNRKRDRDRDRVRKRLPPKPPAPRDWPVGTQSTEFALVATNIPPKAPYNATTILLESKSNRHVLLALGDKVGEFEVVQISMDWVQLRKGGAKTWVTYGKQAQGRSRSRGRARGSARGGASSDGATPRRVKRLPPLTGRKVTYKWLIGRLNLHGELEEHLAPKVTPKGVEVGKVSSGFRRIGMRKGDVVQRAGNLKVRSLDDIRNGLQSAARVGGRGTITVLRKGKPFEIHFGVK